MLENHGAMGHEIGIPPGAVFVQQPAGPRHWRREGRGFPRVRDPLQLAASSSLRPPPLESPKRGVPYSRTQVL
jgi:hypothetical protein